MNIDPLVLYLCCIVIYTLVEHIIIRVKDPHKEKRKIEWTAYLIIIPFIFVLSGSIVEFNEYHTQPKRWNIAGGLLFFIISLILRSMGQLSLGKGFSPFIGKAKDHTLATGSLYKYIRHPLYLATVIYMIACPLMLAAKWTWLFTLLGTLGIVKRIQLEEKFLIKNFPQYPDYMKNTWKLIPGIY